MADENQNAPCIYVAQVGDGGFKFGDASNGVRARYQGESGVTAIPVLLTPTSLSGSRSGGKPDLDGSRSFAREAIETLCVRDHGRDTERQKRQERSRSDQREQRITERNKSKREQERLALMQRCKHAKQEQERELGVQRRIASCVRASFQGSCERSCAGGRLPTP